jgi:hypothetical protein
MRPRWCATARRAVNRWRRAERRIDQPDAVGPAPAGFAEAADRTRFDAEAPAIGSGAAAGDLAADLAGDLAAAFCPGFAVAGSLRVPPADGFATAAFVGVADGLTAVDVEVPVLVGAAAFSAAGLAAGALPFAAAGLASAARLVAVEPEAFSIDVLTLIAGAFWALPPTVRAFVAAPDDFTVSLVTGFAGNCSEAFFTVFAADVFVSANDWVLCSLGFSFSAFTAFLAFSSFFAIAVLRIGAAERSMQTQTIKHDSPPP